MAIQKIRLYQVYSNTVEYDNLEDQVEGMMVPFYQDFTATEGQTVFVLNTTYKVGDNSLKVFLNGFYQENGSDYIESSANQVTFTNGLEAGDWVMFRIEGAGSGTTLEEHVHITRETPTGSINGTNKSFSLQFTPKENTEQVYKNGVLQMRGEDVDYVIVNNVITFNSAPYSGTKILVNYII